MKIRISRDEASTFRNGRTVYNSTGEKSVRGNSIDAKQLDDNAPHLSLARYTAPNGDATSSAGLGSFVTAEIRSPSRRGFLIIQFRATPTALVRNARRVVIEPHFLRCAPQCVIGTRSAGGERDGERISDVRHAD